MINSTLKADDAIFKALDLKTIQRLICYTDKGMLALQIRKGEQNYHLTLDSVPVEKELNKELMQLLFPVPKMDIKMPITETTHILHNLEGKTKTSTVKEVQKIIEELPKKKAGRPKKVK